MKTTKNLIQNPTALRAFLRNPSNIGLMKTLFQAVAFCETLRPVITAKQTEIINFYGFETDPEMGPVEKITTPNLMWTATEEDFALYAKEMDAFYLSEDCPVKPTKAGNCPLLEAEQVIRELKRQIADAFEPYFGFGADRLLTKMDAYDEYFKLLMEMFAPFVK